MAFKWCDKRIRKLSCYDLGLTKLCVLAFALGIVSGWQLFQNWVVGTEWYLFIGAAVIFGILPMKHFWFN